MWFRKKADYAALLKKYLDGDFAAFACGVDAPSKSDISTFEKTMQARLPADFIDFSLSPNGGIYIEVKESIWPRYKEGDVGPFWSFLYGIFVYGFGKEIPEWMDIRIQTPLFRQHAGIHYTPFLKVIGDADIYCFDEGGLVRRWNHETGETDLQDKTFLEVLEFEISELKNRKIKKKGA